MPASSPTWVYFASDTLGSLVALDEGNGLLNFKMIFRPSFPNDQEVNAPLVIALMLCLRVLQFLIRHSIIRVLGTCLITASFKGDRQTDHNTGNSSTADKMTASTNIIALFGRVKIARARIRLSLVHAFIYSFTSGCCFSLLSMVSESYLWLTCAEIATSVLLEGLHLRWTRSILLKAGPPGLFGSASQKLIIYSALVYAVAQKLVTDLPLAIGLNAAGSEGQISIDELAARDVAALALSFALRFAVLYPTWASLICFEADTAPLAQESNGLDTCSSYIRTLRACYRRTLLRLAGLHLQAAGIMIVTEALMYTVFIVVLP